MAIIWNKKMFRPYPVLPLQGSTFTSECRKYRIGEGRDLWRRVPKHFKRLSYLEGNSTRTTLWWVGMYTLFQSVDPWPRRRVTQQPKRRCKNTNFFSHIKKKLRHAYKHLKARLIRFPISFTKLKISWNRIKG